MPAKYLLGAGTVRERKDDRDSFGKEKLDWLVGCCPGLLLGLRVTDHFLSSAFLSDLKNKMPPRPIKSQADSVSLNMSQFQRGLQI